MTEILIPVRVAAIASALPERRVPNSEISAAIQAADPEGYDQKPTTPEWIERRTQIRYRHIADPSKGENTGYFTEIAGGLALEKAGFDPETIGVFVLATVTPDDKFPATANQVQGRLGMTNAFSFDLSAACTGFVYADFAVSCMMSSAKTPRGLVAGIDTLSTIMEPGDRTTAPLFGDGGGALALELCGGKSGIAGYDLVTRSNRADLYAPLFENLRPGTIKMANGRPVYEAGIEFMVNTTKAALKMAKMTSKDIDVYVPHQANGRMIDIITEQLDIPPEKVVKVIDHIGNTSAGSIPIALAEYADKNLIGPGAVVAESAAGGGFTGGTLVRIW